MWKHHSSSFDKKKFIYRSKWTVGNTNNQNNSEEETQQRDTDYTITNMETESEEDTITPPKSKQRSKKKQRFSVDEIETLTSRMSALSSTSASTPPSLMRGRKVPRIEYSSESSGDDVTLVESDPDVIMPKPFASEPKKLRFVVPIKVSL